MNRSLAAGSSASGAINAAIGDTGRAVQAAARHHKFHLVREYLDAGVRDGQSRLDDFLITYFGATDTSTDTSYIRAIGPRWLISGVARIFRPGCQADHAIIVEGPQGKLKSTALRLLAVNDAWFTDRLSQLGSKDAALEAAGVWIIEIAELDALNRASTATTKSYITRRFDRFRPPYGKYVGSLPRQCIFAGSINPPTDGRYLKDPTGARRYWPFPCGRIDLTALERDHGQLWAEAVHRYRADEPWWLETPELEALATAEQAARTVLVDAWEPMVREWLGDRTDVSIWEVLTGALGIAEETATNTEQKRVAAILIALKFVPYRATVGGKRPHRYRKTPRPKEV
jgi:predicted P-loop ATPase